MIENESAAPDDGSFVLPTSFAQQRLWFLEQFEPGTALYNVPVAMRIDGHLDLDLATRALNEIVARHEVLRTTIEAVDGMPMQHVAPELLLAPEITDLSALPIEEARAQAYAMSQAEARIPFRLDVGPLIRVRVLRLTPMSHLLVVTMHHIISDGGSIGLLVKEFSRLYTAYAQGKPSPLPELDIQYGDYAAWQRESLAGPVLQKQLDYWRERLTGAPPLLTLPTDRPRPAQQSYAGDDYFFDIPPPVAAALHAMCKRLHVTLFTALTAAFAILLSRHAGQQDICIGTVAANRDRPETAPLIGVFLNTLVLRTQVDGNLSFEALLRQVYDTTLDAFSHQDVPFEQLSDVLKLERQTAYSPFFQALLVLQNAEDGRLTVPGLDFQMQDAKRNTALYDLTLNLVERDDYMFAYIEYSSALFDKERIARMGNHLVQIFSTVAFNPAVRVDAIDMMQDEERRSALFDWARAPAEYPEATVAALFEQQAAATPERVALIAGDERIAYRELNQRANRLAHRLLAQGVAKGDLVGICAGRTPDMVVALLAILKCGAAYLPLDPGYPAERLAYMLEDARPVLLLADPAHLGNLPPHALPLLALGHDDGVMAHTNPPLAAGADDAAYVIYSSGSTGKPKGVLVPHRQVINRFHWFWQRYPFDATTVGCHKTSINFVDSLWEVFGYLLAGAPTVLVPDEALYDHDQLVALLAAGNVTHMWLVPSLLGALLQRYPDLDQRIPALRFWSPGGEALTADLLALFRQRLPHATLLNLYGLSEAWDAAYAEYGPASAEREALIGRPLANVELYVLDQSFNPVPAGVAGELYVGGAGLALGYLRRPGMTAERFLPHPFCAVPGKRLYRTGDLASFRSDGQLVYLGRADAQLKIRGFRIEPAEIEAAMMEIDGVRAAVVLAREDNPGDLRLVGYVVADGAAQDLRQQLGQALPGYMVPAHIVVLDAMPLNPNGKIDRKALPAPDHSAQAAAYVAPRNELEQAIADIWASVLKVERVGVSDDFFALGGHSLLAMQLISQIRDQFQVQLQPRLLFDQPTVATTAALVEALIMAEIDKLSDQEALAMANQSEA